MIQDIGSHVYDNAYHPVPPEADSFFLCYDGDQALILPEGEEISFPRARDLAGVQPDLYTNYTYLFSIDADRFYLADTVHFPLPESFMKDAGATWVPSASFREARPKHLAFAGITGHQLYNWYSGHQFCSRCGAPLRPDEVERMLYCDQCHRMEYPRISPAVIVGVTNGDRLLLTKYAGRRFTGYALIAGFCEIGETLEDTVRREVKEEVGLEVSNIRYYKSQPWSFSDSLLSGFYCDLAHPDSIHLEEDELAQATWFERKEIPVSLAQDGSLTKEMITTFYEGKA